MYLIRGKLAGKDIPDDLPPTLIPPANLPELNEGADGFAPTPGSSAAGATNRVHTPPPPYDENLSVDSNNSS
jgi:hypothetical protein